VRSFVVTYTNGSTEEVRADHLVTRAVEGGLVIHELTIDHPGEPPRVVAHYASAGVTSVVDKEHVVARGQAQDRGKKKS
jgi:hypothetical protein